MIKSKSFFEMQRAKSEFDFRQARTVEELANLLRLRYRIYRRSKLKGFVKAHASKMDLDIYDCTSIHFGLFDQDRQALGYLRLATRRPSPQNKELEEIVAMIPGIKEKISQSVPADFPMLSYFPDADVIKTLCCRLDGLGDTTVEVSRLCIDPLHHSQRLAMHIALSAMSFGYFCHGVDHALLTCSPCHKKVYETFGFSQVPGTAVHELNGVPRCCLWGSKSGLPAALRSRLVKMAEEFEKTGGFRYAIPGTSRQNGAMRLAS
jgi:hypothetical protein